MYQIDNSTAVAVIPPSTASGTAGFFTDGSPATNVPATLLPAEFMNMVMMEILGVLNAAGVTPSKSNFTQLTTAIRAVNKQATILADTGTAGAYSAVNVPALTALPATGFTQRINIAHLNPGAATYAPDGLASKPIYGLGLQALQGGELPVGIAVLMYLVQAGVNGGNGAWIIIESLGGAQQVTPATQSQHAMQLGQAVGRLLNIQVFATAGSFTYTPTTGTNKVRVRAVGGGGAGGGAPATASGVGSIGACGSSGSYGESLYTSAFAGVTVTVGAGGTGSSGTAGTAGGASSFGVLLSVPGGLFGTGFPSLTASIQAGALSPALPTGANLVSSRGVRGSQAVLLSATLGGNGDGGASVLGMGIGSGGGGNVNPQSSSATVGLAGSIGIVIVEEYA